MTQNLVSLAPDELALWLGLSLEATQEKVRARTEEGRWRLVAGADPEGSARIELPAADLNAEIDARHETGRGNEAEVAQAAGLDAELARARRRNQELHELLQQAGRAIEEVQSKLCSEPQLAELEAAKAKAARMSDDLVEAKAALIDAFDKILDLQQKLLAAQSGMAAAREDAAAIEGICTILERLKTHRS